jgi:hypothetical protein
MYVYVYARYLDNSDLDFLPLVPVDKSHVARLEIPLLVNTWPYLVAGEMEVANELHPRGKPTGII